MVYHRGYDVREPVEVRISHDDLVVLSYPGPDRSVCLWSPDRGTAKTIGAARAAASFH